MPGGKIIIQLESRRTIKVDTGLLMRDGMLVLNPDVERLGLLFLNFRRSKIAISAGPYVGLIPLTDDIVVDVRPKMPISNVAHVVDRAKGQLIGLAETERLYLSEASLGSGVLDFLAGNLVKAVEDIAAQGLHKEYVRRTECTSSPRGRILASDTFRRLWPQGIRHRAWVSQFEQTVDTLPNKIIKSALVYYLRCANRMELSRNMVRRVDACLHYLPAAVSEISGFDLAQIVAEIEHADPGAGRVYYAKALRIATFILSGNGISLDRAGSDLALESFIVNFETIFEEYLRRTLGVELAGECLVRNGNTDGRKPLFDDTKDHFAQPDVFLLSADRSKRVIAEVKYKDKPNRDDINQAVTYALSYRCARSVLVHQLKEGQHARVRHIGKVAGIEVIAYGFDLAAADLKVEEVQFAGWLASQLQEPTASGSSAATALASASMSTTARSSRTAA